MPYHGESARKRREWARIQAEMARRGQRDFAELWNEAAPLPLAHHPKQGRTDASSRGAAAACPVDRASDTSRRET